MLTALTCGLWLPIWILIVFAVLGILAGFGAWALRSANKREEQQRQEQFQRDMLAHRAEREDKLYQAGDHRDVYGEYLPPASLRADPDSGGAVFPGDR